MESFLDGIALLGIPAVLLVPVIVQGAKGLGLPARWAGAAAMLAGFAVAALAEAVPIWPQITPFVHFIVAGTLLGLASAGAYSQYKALHG